MVKEARNDERNRIVLVWLIQARKAHQATVTRANKATAKGWKEAPREKASVELPYAEVVASSSEEDHAQTSCVKPSCPSEPPFPVPLLSPKKAARASRVEEITRS